MTNSTEPRQVPLEPGSTEAAFYRVAVGDISEAVNRISAGVGVSKAIALVSAAVGHLHGAIYQGDGGERSHLHNFRVGVEEGKKMRLAVSAPEGTA